MSSPAPARLAGRLKEVARTLAARAFGRLPRGLRQAMVERHADHADSFDLLCRLAARHHVSAFRVDGAWGPVLGSAKDRGVLRGYARDGVWAPLTERLVTAVLAPSGGSYLDIGANIGLTVIPVARRAEVAVHAFEPDPDCFAFLTRNVAELCPHGNVVLHPVAVCDVAGRLPLSRSADNMGDNNLVFASEQTPRPQRRETLVEAGRLDELVDLGRLTRPVAVKVDSQGAEARVVAGGHATLAAAELLLLELWPAGFRRVGGDAEAMLRFLAATYRRGFVVAGEAGGEVDWRPADEICQRLADLLAATRGGDYFDAGFSSCPAPAAT